MRAISLTVGVEHSLEVFIPETVWIGNSYTVLFAWGIFLDATAQRLVGSPAKKLACFVKLEKRRHFGSLNNDRLGMERPMLLSHLSL